LYPLLNRKNTMNKHKLIAYLIVKSVNNKDVPMDIAQWALDLGAKPMDLRLQINYLHNQGELRLFEHEGQPYVNLFG